MKKHTKIAKDKRTSFFRFLKPVTKAAVYGTALLIVIATPETGMVNNAHAVFIEAGCTNIANKGQQPDGSFKYVVSYHCNNGPRAKVDWANAIDSRCIVWRNGSVFTTSRKKSWRYGKRRPWVRNIKNC